MASCKEISMSVTGIPKPQHTSPLSGRTSSTASQYGVHTQTKEKRKIKMVQRRSARYVTNRYRNMSSITDMLEELNWESLESRRTKIQLTLLYKIMNVMVDIPTSPYVTQAFASTRWSHTMKLRQISSRTDAYKYSSFPRTIPFWNSLPAEASDLVSFKRELSTLTF